jgi:hypothetical protein
MVVKDFFNFCTTVVNNLAALLSVVSGNDEQALLGGFSNTCEIE